MTELATSWALPPDAVASNDGAAKSLKKPAASSADRLAPGTIVYAEDKGNYGRIVSDNGETCSVHFVNPATGQERTKELPKSLLRLQDGRPLEGVTIDPGPPPIPLREIVSQHPKLRPSVIKGLLRQGETMNVVAAPKQGKSWLTAGLALSVAGGFDWLDTFPSASGRVLMIDGELHPETLSHRLPMVAAAMGVPDDYADRIDVWALRGKGVDLFTLGDRLQQIEPGRYAIIILDAWYRFLPPGISENDNASVMALYNVLDGYADRLGAAWVNIHHASKGDQSDKGITDVGSGAGSQSRAADTHLIIRPHAEDDVAVIQAVVRSWPPVEPLAIRWTFPTWQLDTEADPRKLRKPRGRTSREDKDRHLDEDRQAIVDAMHALGRPETKTCIRDAAAFGNPRFRYAWASLLKDRTVVPLEGQITKSNGQSYDAFKLSSEDSDP